MDKILMSDVLDIFQIDNKGKSNFNIVCPMCGAEGSRPTLNINLSKNVFNCPKCNTSGDFVGLYGILKYCEVPVSFGSNPERYKKLISEIRVSMKSPISIEYAKKRGENPYPKNKQHEVTDIKKRHLAYSGLLRLLNISESHVQNLLHRGLTEKEIISANYKSYPDMKTANQIVNQLLKKGISPEGVPGFYRAKKSGLWELVYNPDGILIPVRDEVGLIQGLQLRLDTPDMDGKRKYKWISSSGMNDGTSAHIFVHASGYQTKKIVITEGPLKGDIINHFLKLMVLSVPGVSSQSYLPEMIDKIRPEEIFIAFDMDYKENKNVKKGIEKIKRLAGEKEIACRTIEWDDSFKGLDDFLYANHQANKDPWDGLLIKE